MPTPLRLPVFQALSSVRALASRTSAAMIRSARSRVVARSNRLMSVVSDVRGKTTFRALTASSRASSIPTMR